MPRSRPASCAACGTLWTAQPRPSRAHTALALQPDPPDRQRLDRLVIGGGAEPAVGNHRAWRLAGALHDPLQRRDQLRRIRWIALVELVVGDKAALVLGHQQRGAELGRLRGLPLRIGRAAGSLRRTSRSGILRLPASRCAVWSSSRVVAPIVSSSSPTSRPSHPWPPRR